jgi:hypothetical protein
MGSYFFYNFSQARAALPSSNSFDLQFFTIPKAILPLLLLLTSIERINSVNAISFKSAIRATLCGKNPIINKSLYGLKTSAVRFHEYLAESLLRLGFQKTKHDPDLWMIDKTSHYEYLATHADDILIWSNDPMSVIKSLEKIYLLKNVGIPEYYLGGNVEFLGDAWKNQGLRLAISARTYIQNVIP